MTSAARGTRTVLIGSITGVEVGNACALSHESCAFSDRQCGIIWRILGSDLERSGDVCICRAFLVGSPEGEPVGSRAVGLGMCAGPVAEIGAGRGILTSALRFGAGADIGLAVPANAPFV
jgi:hypothetical protein